MKKKTKKPKPKVKRQQVDAEYQAMVQLGAAAGKHDREVLKAKEGAQ